jgi:hypothetical protein
MKLIETILLIGVVSLTGVVVYQAITIREQQAQLSAAQDQFTAASLNFQAKCAGQAKVVFNEFSGGTKDFASYENHYNRKLGKCFVFLRSQSAKQLSATSYGYLADAFENKDVGDFYIYTADYTKANAKPMSCQVTSLSGQRQQCETEAQFKALIRPYMEE